MKRFVFAALLTAALGSMAVAQPVPVPPPEPPPTAVPVPHPSPIPPPPIYSGPPGPAIPFVKSGGRVVGTDGYYPYDTGLWLLGGTAVSRQAGYFTMVYPGGNAVPGEAFPAVPATRGHFFKHGRFHR